MLRPSSPSSSTIAIAVSTISSRLSERRCRAGRAVDHGGSLFATEDHPRRASRRTDLACEHPRRRRAPQHLRLRSPGPPGAAHGATAPRAALPHPDPRVLPARHAGGPLPLLAAGPVRQPCRPARLPRTCPRAERHGRPRRGHDRHQPVRLLRRGVGGDVAAALRARSRARPRRLPGARGRRPAAGCVGRGRPAPPTGHRRLPRRAQPACAGQRRVLAAHGARRAAAGRDAAPRASRPATSSSSSPTGRRARTSRTCTRGRRPTSRGPAGSASIRPRACSRARGTSRWPARRGRRAPRPSRGRSRRGRRRTSRTRTPCAGCARTRASPHPTTRTRGGASTRSAAPSMRPCRRATSA